MKVINFGSLNIDKVYCVDEIVRPGETITASGFELFTGGKGLNQSVAVSRAGQKCIHFGALGSDGGFLKNYLAKSGVEVSEIVSSDEATGHAIIQVDKNGQNSIIVFGGANRKLSKYDIDKVVELIDHGDFVLLQNETNEVEYIIRKAHSAGAKVVWNPSPFPKNVENYPLHLVDIFIVNEIEGALLTQNPQFQNLKIEKQNYENVINDLQKKFPQTMVVMTLGSEGVICSYEGQIKKHCSYSVDVVDTTAAGDTFCGYFLAMLCGGKNIETCLEVASAAAAITVTRKGAAPSIPKVSEVENFLIKR